MFCDNCLKDSRVGITNKVQEFTIRGTKVSVEYRARVCACCGVEVYDADLEASCIKKARQMYREKMKLLPGDKIRAYMNQNGLTAQQMAALADCAVSEILCACNDSMMDKKTSDKLRKAISA